MEEYTEINNGEIIKNALEDFEKTQKYMILARKENATETYAELKRQYIVLKTLLNSLSVDFSGLDCIKE